jgi:hypothetical protein
MATVLECITEEQHCCAFLCGQKNSVQRIFINKYILFMVGSVCRVKKFTTGSRNCQLVGKRFADDEEVETEVRKWLSNSQKTSVHWFSDGTGVSVLVEDMSRNKVFFFSRFEYHMFYGFYIHLCLSRMFWDVTRFNPVEVRRRRFGGMY